MIDKIQVQLIRDLAEDLSARRLVLLDYDKSSYARSFTASGVRLSEVNLRNTAKAWGVVLGPVRP